MSVRGVQEVVVHVESFRNIDLWYQGAYMLRIQVYFERKGQRVYAHPFAHTHELAAEGDPQPDPQVIKQAALHAASSSFLTKCFLLRYYEEEVQLNDIAHFRVETEAGAEEELVMEVGLLFFDQQVKKVEPEEVTVEKAKTPRVRRFLVRGGAAGVHQFVPVSFEGQYFSLANLTLHALTLDYRFRVCPLQLFEFSQLSQADKRRLLDKNRKIQPKQPNYAESLAASLGLDGPALLAAAEHLLVRRMKQAYEALLKDYRLLFARSITEAHKQLFASILVHPSQLSLFEDESTGGKGSEEERLFKRYRTRSHNELIEAMLNETNLISGELLKLWHHYLDVLRCSPRLATAHLEHAYLETQQRHWRKLRRVCPIPARDVALAPQRIDEVHLSLEKELFAERAKLEPEGSVVAEEFYSKRSGLCLMVEDSFAEGREGEGEGEREQEQEREGGPRVQLHLVVLVHGFQGNSLDMKLIKNNISLLYPEASFLCASSNEDMTDTDILEMGARLAQEVKTHINEFFPAQSLARVSFIGHSLGGVIIRAALPRLGELREKFHTFMSFSSPHLGYKVNASSVIEAGIWVLQKFKNSHCLKQLTMADHADPRATCLYAISRMDGLRHFRHLFLFSSKQDSYAPYESARIEIHPDFMNARDPLKDIHCEMVRNILGEVACDRVHRLRVHFTIQETNLDSIIGRTAHILFLENSELVQMFLHTHPALFT